MFISCLIPCTLWYMLSLLSRTCKYFVFQIGNGQRNNVISRGDSGGTGRFSPDAILFI